MKTENIEELLKLTKELTDHALTMSIATNYGRQFNFANVSRVRLEAEKELAELKK